VGFKGLKALWDMGLNPFSEVIFGIMDRRKKARILGVSDILNKPSFMNPIYHSNDLLYNTEELTFLTDLSPTELTWDEHRANADDMAVLYNKNLDFIKYGDRINGCSGYLKFGVNPDQGKLILKEVWFCRVRHCPVCQWRRSLRMRAMVYQNIEKIMSEYPSHRWIFLTLTVKNPHVTDLRSTIQEMNTGWKRLTQSKRFSNVVDGFIRTTEVTRPQKRGRKWMPIPTFTRCSL
jgi:plasmid rolling circle replication initiator protein Rep